MSTLMRGVACLAIALMAFGCYSTYQVPRDEFAKIQSSEDPSPRVVVQSDDGEGVEVDQDTGIFVRSTGGRRYPVTPFNFKVTPSQLVASDRDTLLMLDEIESYEVDHISVGWTAALVTVGAAAAAGLIVAIIATTGSKSFE
jgi:hypothetical protein